MRFTSMLSFVLTVAISLSLVQVIPFQLLRPLTERERPTEWLWPSFNFKEATSKVGHRVRCIYRTDLFSGGCEIGERGEVVGVQKESDGGYFIVVRWSNQSQDEPCYYGRYSRRVVLAEE